MFAIVMYFLIFMFFGGGVEQIQAFNTFCGNVFSFLDGSFLVEWDPLLKQEPQDIVRMWSRAWSHVSLPNRQATGGPNPNRYQRALTNDHICFCGFSVYSQNSSLCSPFSCYNLNLCTGTTVNVLIPYNSNYLLRR